VLAALDEGLLEVEGTVEGVVLELGLVDGDVDGVEELDEEEGDVEGVDEVADEDELVEADDE